MKTREQLISEAARQLEALEQCFRDVEHWNQTRGQTEGQIDPDPDGSMQMMAQSFREFLQKNELPRDIWKDPAVQAALKEGRSADDIAVLPCPNCGEYGYYNEGSHFYCRFCNKGFSCLTEDEEPPEGVPYLYLEGHTTLADTVTDVTDGYHNRTRPAE
jgi:hypothetical protein